MRTDRDANTKANRAGLTLWRALAGMGVSFPLVALVAFGILAAACGDDPTPTPVPTATTAPAPTATMPPEPTATPAPTAAPEPRPARVPEPERKNDLTTAYVREAIEFYETHGLDATVGRYNSPISMDGERALFLLTREGFDVLAAPMLLKELPQSV